MIAKKGPDGLASRERFTQGTMDRPLIPQYQTFKRATGPCVLIQPIYLYRDIHWHRLKKLHQSTSPP